MAYDPANPFSVLMSGAERTYNHLPNQQYAAFNYAYNPYADNGNGITGQHQLLTTNNQGALRVDIGTGVNIQATITGLEVQLDNVTVTGGNINATIINSAPIAVTGTVNPTVWQKAKTAGYVSTFNVSASACVVNKVQGFTKTTTQPSYVMLFDLAATPTAGANPDFVVAVQTNNNYFLDLAEAGVAFTNGLQIVSSSTPDVYTSIGTPDFICSVVYK
jgi:hypothetical protein